MLSTSQFPLAKGYATPSRRWKPYLHIHQTSLLFFFFFPSWTYLVCIFFMKSFLVLERLHEIFHKFFCNFTIFQFRSRVVILYCWRNRRICTPIKFRQNINKNKQININTKKVEKWRSSDHAQTGQHHMPEKELLPKFLPEYKIRLQKFLTLSNVLFKKTSTFVSFIKKRWNILMQKYPSISWVTSDT